MITRNLIGFRCLHELGLTTDEHRATLKNTGRLKNPGSEHVNLSRRFEAASGELPPLRRPGEAAQQQDAAVQLEALHAGVQHAHELVMSLSQPCAHDPIRKA